MTITSNRNNKSQHTLAEKLAHIITLICAIFAVAALVGITLYMIINGLPAFIKVGPGAILFDTKWAPTAAEAHYGIAYIILTSLIGTAIAIALGVPIGLLTAVFLSELAPKSLYRIVKPAVSLLAGIPSVIYGMLGLMVLTPAIYKLEKLIYANNSNHQFTGGSNFIAAVIVLVVMILPTVISMSETALQAVPRNLRETSLALGATQMQTCFKVVVPAARSGITSAAVLGTGRAIGEAMAISLVAGSAVNAPWPFNSVRFLTTAIVSEMGYAADTHRQVLFSIGLVLFVIIMLLNLGLNYFQYKEEQKLK